MFESMMEIILYQFDNRQRIDVTNCIKQRPKNVKYRHYIYYSYQKFIQLSITKARQ
jgi:hypothetical protein